MAFHNGSPETDALARRVAAPTKVGLAEAVHVALARELERAENRPSQLEEPSRVTRDFRAGGDPAKKLPADKDFVDRPCEDDRNSSTPRPESDARGRARPDRPDASDGEGRQAADLAHCRPGSTPPRGTTDREESCRDETGAGSIPPDPGGVEPAAIHAALTTLAVDVRARFGERRRTARLDMGDRFARACARHLGQPLPYEGDGLESTDIEAARGQPYFAARSASTI